MDRKELIIDEVATKRLHKAIEAAQSEEDIFKLLINQIEKEKEEK